MDQESVPEKDFKVKKNSLICLDFLGQFHFMSFVKYIIDAPL